MVDLMQLIRHKQTMINREKALKKEIPEAVEDETDYKVYDLSNYPR